MNLANAQSRVLQAVALTDHSASHSDQELPRQRLADGQLYDLHSADKPASQPAAAAS